MHPGLVVGVVLVVRELRIVLVERRADGVRVRVLLEGSVEREDHGMGCSKQHGISQEGIRNKRRCQRAEMAAVGS
jgi:hypothetical protein